MAVGYATMVVVVSLMGSGRLVVVVSMLEGVGSGSGQGVGSSGCFGLLLVVVVVVSLQGWVGCWRGSVLVK